MASRLAHPAVVTRPVVDALLRAPRSENTVVVLLGWAGAHDKNLAKYSKMYEDRGFVTVRFTAVFDGVLPSDIRHGRDLSLLLPDFDAVAARPSTRLLFHLLSMNGCYTFVSLLNARGHELLDRTDAIVMDSCPIHMFPFDIRSTMRVVDFALERVFPGRSWNAVLVRLLAHYYKRLSIQLFVYYVCPLLLRSHLLQLSLRLWLGLTKRVDVSPFHYMLNLDNFPRQLLFVYSKKDDICNHKMISEFADWQEGQRRADVRRLLFDESPHVEHLKNYPAEYTDAVDRLLKELRQPKANL